MTNKQLKEYALAGILSRIAGEEEKMKFAPNDPRRQEIQDRIDVLKAHYTEIQQELCKELL